MNRAGGRGASLAGASSRRERCSTTIAPTGERLMRCSPGMSLKSGSEHGTQKPVECMRRPIVNNSRPGQAVYDPFLGSGTSVIAADMTGRVCCGMELSPPYVDVVVRRWQLFTGRKALHQASGQSFAERVDR